MTQLEKLLAPKYKSIKELPYRQGVIGIIIDDRNQFLVVQMVSYGEDQWRFPGGGLENEETHSEALLRELSEELGSVKFEIIKESIQINKYDWPEQVIIDQIKNKKRYFRGQEQRQFLVKFTGKRKDLKPDTKELRRIEWLDYKDLESHFIFDQQWKLAEKVLKELL